MGNAGPIPELMCIAMPRHSSQQHPLSEENQIEWPQVFINVDLVSDTYFCKSSLLPAACQLKFIRRGFMTASGPSLSRFMNRKTRLTLVNWTKFHTFSDYDQKVFLWKTNSRYEFFYYVYLLSTVKLIWFLSKIDFLPLLFIALGQLKVTLKRPIAAHSPVRLFSQFKTR